MSYPKPTDGSKFGGHSTNTNEYRTQRETLQRVVASDGTTNPVSFTVTDKSGTTSEYTTTIEAANNAGIRRLWLLTKVSDTSGNYLTVAYDKSDVATSGDYRPTSISYTSNVAVGLTANNSIAFTYSGGRPDVVPLYEGGSLTTTLKLLTNITSYSGGNKIREYRLSYDNYGAVGRSRMTSVQECGTDGVCMTPTTVSWSTDAASFGDLNLRAWGNSGQNPRVFAADFNGDGKTDILDLLQNGDSSFDWRLRLSSTTSFGDIDLGTSARQFGLRRSRKAIHKSVRQKGLTRPTCPTRLLPEMSDPALIRKSPDCQFRLEILREILSLCLAMTAARHLACRYVPHKVHLLRAQPA